MAHPTNSNGDDPILPRCSDCHCGPVRVETDLTVHASERIRQRGLRECDVDLVLDYGTDTDEGVLLTEKDAAREISECRRRIAQLERLKGTMIFVRESRVVTVYRPTRDQCQRILKRQSGMRRVRPHRRARHA